MPFVKMSFSTSEDDLGVFKEKPQKITVKSVARYALVFMLVAVMVGFQIKRGISYMI
jgi:hypothetical protein